MGGWECTQVLNRFFLCLDERRYADLLGLMLPEATWFRQGRLLRGHAEVLEALNVRSPTMLIRHIITNAVVDVVADDAANGSAYMTAYRFDDGKPHDALAKIQGPFRISSVATRYVARDGAWRIAEQRTETLFDF